MEATEKEQKLLAQIFHSNIIIGVLIIMFGFMVFAKTEAPEYRPIVLSTRTIVANTAYMPSSTRYTLVDISVQISCSLSLSGGTAATWVIQTSATSGGTYTTWQTISSSNTGSLTIGLNTAQISSGILETTVPPGFYYKIVSTSTTGTATFSILNSATETQL